MTEMGTKRISRCTIYDAALHPTGILCGWESLVWCEEYIGPGRFLLVTAANSSLRALLRPGCYAGIPDSVTLMRLCSAEDRDGRLYVYGAEAKTLLSMRIADGTVRCDGRIEAALRAAVAGTRPFPVLGAGVDRGLPAEAYAGRSYLSLFALSREWCALGGYGFRLVHDAAARLLRYDVYAGEERPGVVLRESFGSLSGVQRTLSDAQYRNVAIVGGEGEGSDRVFVTVTEGDREIPEGERRELFADARDLRLTAGQTEAQYRTMLRARGREKLAAACRVNELTLRGAGRGYGTAFTLGDRVRCVLPEYGEALTLRVTAVTFCDEDGGAGVTVRLGEPTGSDVTVAE